MDLGKHREIGPTKFAFFVQEPARGLHFSLGRATDRKILRRLVKR